MRRQACGAVAVVLGLMVGTGGCGGAVPSRPSADEGPVQYGAGLEVSTTTAPVAVPGGSAADGPVAASTPRPPSADEGPAAAAASTTALAANASVRNDAATGLRLRLVVDGRLSYAADEDVKLQLEVENRGTAEVIYDTNQRVFFGLADADNRLQWTNEACVADTELRTTTGVLRLAPGEKVTFVRVYPTQERESQSSERPCRVSPGSYQAVGFIDVCPPGALVDTPNGQPYCDRDRVETVPSAPVVIQIRGS